MNLTQRSLTMMVRLILKLKEMEILSHLNQHHKSRLNAHSAMKFLRSGEFSNAGILCAQPVQRSLTAEEDQLTGYVMLKDARSQFKLSFHFSQVGWYNSLTDTFD